MYYAAGRGLGPARGNRLTQPAGASGGAGRNGIVQSRAEPPVRPPIAGQSIGRPRPAHTRRASGGVAFGRQQWAAKRRVVRYGHFDDERREYVITRPDTPLALDQLPGQRGLLRDHLEHRRRLLLLPRRPPAPPDPLPLQQRAAGPGRPLRLPARRRVGRVLEPELAAHPARARGLQLPPRPGLLDHRLAPTRASAPRPSTSCPLGENLEIWRIRVTNERTEPPRRSRSSARSSSACGTPWTTPPTSSATTPSARSRSRTASSTTRPSTASGATTSPTSPARSRWPASTRSATPSWAPTAAGIARSRSSSGKAADSIAHGWQPMGSHHVKLELAPGRDAGGHRPARLPGEPPGRQVRSARLADDQQEAGASRSSPATCSRPRSRRPSPACATTGRTAGHPAGPAPGTSTSTGWSTSGTPYQCMVTFNMSRSASLFESGIGRGHGLPRLEPGPAGLRPHGPGARPRAHPRHRRDPAADAAAPTTSTSRSPSAATTTSARGFNDDPPWLVLGVAAYLKETGDASILDEPVPYDNKPGTETPLYEHLQRSIQYTLERLGPHGLPLIGRADWNDCLNLNCFSETPGESFQTTENKEGGVAESVFIGGLFVLAADEMAEIAELRGDDGRGRALPTGGGDDDATWSRPARLGRRLVPPRLRLLRPARRLAGVRGGPDLHRAAGHVRHGRHRPRRRAGRQGARLGRASAWPRRTASSLQQPAFTHYHLHLGEISTYPAATRRTPASSATPTRGS